MTTANQRCSLGRYGERIAADYLRAEGMHLVEANWRCPHGLGEIDLILRDGAEIVFCEVKTRRNESYGHPLEAVDEEKSARLRRLACAWLAAHDVGSVAMRIDVVGILCPVRGEATIEHVRGID